MNQMCIKCCMVILSYFSIFSVFPIVAIHSVTQCFKSSIANANDCVLQIGKTCGKYGERIFQYRLRIHHSSAYSTQNVLENVQQTFQSVTAEVSRFSSANFFFFLIISFFGFQNIW